MTDNGTEMNNQRWEKHSDFLADFAGNIAYLLVTFASGNSREKIESVEHLVKTLSFSAFKHAEGHCREDFENERKSDEKTVDKISVSGDRVKREGPSWDKDKKGWDVAKRGPHVYENAESVGYEGIDDDSVIKTQEECAKRFAEGAAVRRNYAGIND